MKKIFKFLAVSAAAACAVTFAGCSSSTTSTSSLDSYWFISVYPRIQNTAFGTEEKLVYDVTLQAAEESTLNDYYHIELDETKTHTYTTCFGVGMYDWSDNSFEKITDENKDDYKNGNNYTLSDKENQEFVYYLETELVFSGEYVYDASTEASTSVEFDNTISTVTFFRAAYYDMTPIYSYTEAYTMAPMNYQPSTKEDMCDQLDYTYKIQYDKDCSEAVVAYTNNIDEKENKSYTVDLSEAENTFFDNNELYMALRGMNLSSSFSETLSLLIPADGGITDVSVAGSSTAELDTSYATQSKIYNALADKYGEPVTTSSSDSSSDDSTEDSSGSGITYNEVTISNASGKGVSQTAWYAAVEDTSDNTYRATLLYLAIPMSYSLGTLEYTLSEVSSVIAPDV
ncbi:MAG: hypothetical protein LUD27_07270 [Clostridia bacterium]|nr:hypothetical protein [Clostridia bacterium]